MLGVDMGGASGLRLVREFRRRVPEVAVVAFGGFEFAPSEHDLAGQGVNVHLIKGASNAEIVLAVRTATRKRPRPGIKPPTLRPSHRPCGGCRHREPRCRSGSMTGNDEFADGIPIILVHLR